MPFSLCSACRLPSSSVVANLPCEECLASLLASPPICAECLGFACPAESCDRPWLAVAGEGGRLRFDSVRAAYLSVGPGARVLKTWKSAPSPSLDRFLRGRVRTCLEELPKTRPLFLIPVPQSDERRWALAGGSAIRLCAMIRELRKNPADRRIDLLALGKRSSAQALSRGDERYSRPSAIHAREFDSRGEGFFSPAEFESDPVVLLVDDFLTSGTTLRAAAGAVRGKFAELNGFGGGGARLEVFVLGFRPALFGAVSG